LAVANPAGKAVGVSGIGTWFRQTLLPLLGFGPLWKVDVRDVPLEPPKLKQQTEVPKTRSALEFDVLNARRNLMNRPTSLESLARTRKRFAAAVKEREERKNDES
jgi:hypothetical protein